jgi:hypothetical protein
LRSHPRYIVQDQEQVGIFQSKEYRYEYPDGGPHKPVKRRRTRNSTSRTSRKPIRRNDVTHSQATGRRATSSTQDGYSTGLPISAPNGSSAATKQRARHVPPPIVVPDRYSILGTPQSLGARRHLTSAPAFFTSFEPSVPASTPYVNDSTLRESKDIPSFRIESDQPVFQPPLCILLVWSSMILIHQQHFPHYNFRC